MKGFILLSKEQAQKTGLQDLIEKRLFNSAIVRSPEF